MFADGRYGDVQLPLLVAIGLRHAGLAGWLRLATWVVGLGIFLATEFSSKADEIAGISSAALALPMIGSAVPRRTPRLNAVVTSRTGCKNVATSGRHSA